MIEEGGRAHKMIEEDKLKEGGGGERGGGTRRKGGGKTHQILLKVAVLALTLQVHAALQDSEGESCLGDGVATHMAIRCFCKHVSKGIWPLKAATMQVLMSRLYVIGVELRR